MWRETHNYVDVRGMSRSRYHQCCVPSFVPISIAFRSLDERDGRSRPLLPSLPPAGRPLPLVCKPLDGIDGDGGDRGRSTSGVDTPLWSLSVLLYRFLAAEELHDVNSLD